MKKIYHTIETAPKSIKNVERGNIHTPNRNTCIHHRSLSSIDTRTSIKSGGVKIVVWAQTSTPSEMMRLCFPHVVKCQP